MVSESPRLTEQGVRIAEGVPLVAARKMLAAHMAKSHLNIPAVTILEEWNVQALVDLRRRMNERAADCDVQPISYTHLIIRAVAQTLKQHKWLNATITESEIQILDEVNIGVAVSLPNGNLVVPVIRDADKKSVVDIAAESVELAARARTGKLRPSDVRGATFTLTNIGIVPETRWQTPLISSSQCAILATGAIREAPIVRDGQLAVGRVMSASMTFDHRIVSGLPAMLFLKSLSALFDGTAGTGALDHGLGEQLT
jgi:pyruvate dehydrogenase E2 component (dihydrolipoamide acetyltransferase)